MNGETNSSSMAPPTFDRESYQIRAVRMRIYLQALNLWEAVEDEHEIAPLPDNSTVAQIKTHKERKTRKSKAMTCLFTVVSSNILTRIMSLQSAKEVWDYLKTEYEGDERIRGKQVVNLVREFELQRMKESETIKEYSDRLLNLANHIRLLGSTFNDSRIVEKILLTVPERFEATITTLENTKNLSKITLAELLSAFQA
ncbi:uncharacterized protein LOC107876895 [Capsicum annuum]|uniref:uncharacterized protein LOC107876895 n=1 Tax=Capsicum annuum TaxID=4072 RepID=UPI0007BFEC08|nr:uncharacterized protein LOC107876895 [Capsicum annuum]